MEKLGMINVDWDNIDSYDDSDITYFMFLEGKSVDALCKIRNLNKESIQAHILNGKIKYGILAKSHSISDFFRIITNTGKQDKIDTLKCLKEQDKSKLIEFIRYNYVDMNTKHKEIATWILGEIGDRSVIDILSKASVNNHVNVRRMSISALGKIGDKSAENILIRSLDDCNSQVITYSIKALMKIKSKKAREKIKKIYMSASKEYVKMSAKKYLEADFD